ncbi:erythromycin esterase family protein [Kineosporia rhizophila]|uniref:erythromycin esterase family protein n=1 Tax=Kineosporia rhizophila TaxID=84633 RepID=UPI000ABEF4ED|nr:erythromycin esterase family protein [Kineosporia rhizophila]MCE0539104.1 erythromycin esterase family protein [Kineosporia rhizophila]
MGRYGDEVAGLATPLQHSEDLNVLIDRVGDARVVMLGEASHGSHEFYDWRSRITQRLIQELGFTFVAVEGDWPDCERVDQSVRFAEDADPREALQQYRRWPTWMWANEEVSDFSRWLRGHNEFQEPARRVGFHGLDVYSLWESLDEILIHLRERHPELVPLGLDAFHCFEPFVDQPQQYARSIHTRPAGCSCEVSGLLAALRRSDDFNAWQNAEVVAGAEHYYRSLVKGGAASWNVRDRHMDATLARLLDHYGPQSKAVVWAHNTHVGDAWGSVMAEQGETTIGTLARQRYGEDGVVLVGFGTHHGTVVAGEDWGRPMEVMPVPEARRDSLEHVLHETAPDQSLFVFPARAQQPAVLRDRLGHRAIGVVYRPDWERWGNYVPTMLGERYDAFVWCDESHAVRPLHTFFTDVTEPETFPTGV